MCGRKKNVAGEYQVYQNYQNYREQSYQDYAVTKRTARNQEVERKFMKEFSPLDKENLYSYLKRTDVAMNEVIKFATHHHLYGTSKGAWQCHTATRYCFICTLTQLLNVNRTILSAIEHIEPIQKLQLNITTHPDNPDTLSIT